MYLESLLRLAEIMSDFNENKNVLISEKFHKETEELIKVQTDFLIEDLKFRQDNPGPYDFGFGNVTLSIFSPEQTEIQEWAIIARKEDWQKNYRFNSILGLIKSLALILEDTKPNKDVVS